MRAFQFLSKGGDTDFASGCKQTGESSDIISALRPPPLQHKKRHSQTSDYHTFNTFLQKQHKLN